MNDDNLWELWRRVITVGQIGQYSLNNFKDDVAIYGICIQQQFWGEFFSKVR